MLLPLKVEVLLKIKLFLQNQINSKDDYFKVVVLGDQTQVTGLRGG
jgi:hypothetical protein